tara:strand:- start:47 stop:226 length:180 start_codon:yes stop_codon:yes gene_type:complete
MEDKNKPKFNIAGIGYGLSSSTDSFLKLVEKQIEQQEKDKFRTKDQIPKVDPPKMVGYY